MADLINSEIIPKQKNVHTSNLWNWFDIDLLLKKWNFLPLCDHVHWVDSLIKDMAK